MKKRTMNILLILLFMIGIAIGTISVSASSLDRPHLYSVNKNGQTYGSVNPYAAVPQEGPELIAAIGIDGTEGYIYEEDLNGEQPSNPEEAQVYMENLKRAAARAARSNEKYSRYIPLYDSDGVTVIGEFGISYPSFSDEIN